MGVDIGQIVPHHEISIKLLNNKKIAVDTYILLYQFLRSMPRLTDGRGRITTHLSGIFYRTTKLLSLGVKPCFVLDGPFPQIRKHKKLSDATILPRTNDTITQEIIQSTQQLITLLGCPVIQSPSEGEAQTAYMTQKGDVWSAVSQDYDSLIFGAKRMIKNLTFSKTKKLPKKGHIMIGTYLIELADVLKTCKITHDQLIALSMLVGTDFNPGVHGIGQKKGLELVQKYGDDFETLFKNAGWNYMYSWREIYDTLKTMPVSNKYQLKWKPIDEKIVEFLVKEHDFNEKRVRTAIERI